jgi:stage II sporulation protein D
MAAGTAPAQSRPRRVKDSGGKEPSIRIGLATNRTSCSITSKGGLTVRAGGDTAMAASLIEVNVTTVPVKTGRRVYLVVVSPRRGESGRQLRDYLRHEHPDLELSAPNAKGDVEAGPFAEKDDARQFRDRVRDADRHADINERTQDPTTRRGLKASLDGAEARFETTASIDVVASDPDKAPLNFEGVDYRGTITVRLDTRGRITVINTLPMELYLQGVVPNELSPGGFPEIEALKAQAVAARTYAVRNLGQFADQGFDLLPTARSQVYAGRSSEQPLSTRAVEETRGIVATFEGRPINALYTSTCGGRTEDVELVFGRPEPYLRGVACTVEGALESHRLQGMRPDASIPPGLAREAALLRLAGFEVPQLSARYLGEPATRDEILGWLSQLANLLRRTDARAPSDADVTRATGLARALAQITYGAARPALLLTPDDATYLTGDPRGADLAALMRDGILPSDTPLDGRPVTRGVVLAALGRASGAAASRLTAARTEPALAGRLRLRGIKGASPREIELASDCELFRRVGDVTVATGTLFVIGGEQVEYHLAQDGRADFIELTPSENGAAADRFSRFSFWQERLTPDELGARLSKANAAVGRVEAVDILRTGPSGRVTEIEVTGSAGKKVLKGFPLRSALGLRELLFVVRREVDADGKPAAFVFTGRGWGHGVGLCQVGAYGLAVEGATFERILATYYKGVVLTRLY